MKSQRIKVRKVVAAVANGGSLAKGIRKAGYSESIARNPKRITKTKVFEEEAKPFVDELEAQRQIAIARLPSRVNRAGWGTLVEGIHKMTHDIQLLKGRSTGRLDLSFDPDEEAEVEKLLRRNAK